MGADGVVLAKKSITSPTPPRLRGIMKLRDVLSLRASTRPQLRRGTHAAHSVCRTHDSTTALSDHRWNVAGLSGVFRDTGPLDFARHSNKCDVRLRDHAEARPGEVSARLHCCGL